MLLKARVGHISAVCKTAVKSGCEKKGPLSIAQSLKRQPAFSASPRFADSPMTLNGRPAAHYAQRAAKHNTPRLAVMPGAVARVESPVKSLAAGDVNGAADRRERLVGIAAEGGDRSFKIDSVAPSTTDSLAGTLGSNGWYTSSSVSVTLTAGDATSGVGATYYSLDGGGARATVPATPAW